MAATESDSILCCMRMKQKNHRKCKSSLVGGDSAADNSGSEEDSGRNMDCLCEGHNNDILDWDDLKVPSLPPYEKSLFDTDNKDTNKNNDEYGTEEVNEDSISEVALMGRYRDLNLL